MEALRDDKHYTYADYATWDDGVRYELIDGVAYAMAAPSTAHQTVVGEIFNQLYNHLKGKPCRVIVSTFDVRLNFAEDDDIVLQPDIVVVCDKSKLDEKGCNGAPDMVIEVISPSSLRRDTVVKALKYREACVREYWIVDPEAKTVSTYTLENGRYFDSIYLDTGSAPVGVLEGCTISLTDVFAQL